MHSMQQRGARMPGGVVAEIGVDQICRILCLVLRWYARQPHDEAPVRPRQEVALVLVLQPAAKHIRHIRAVRAAQGMRDFLELSTSSARAHRMVRGTKRHGLLPLWMLAA